MTAYKLFRLRKDGSLGSLFINRKDILPENVWLEAAYHPTKGFKERCGWHCCSRRYAPHLSKKGRTWRKVEMRDIENLERPKNQGGLWYIAGKIRILDENYSS